MNDPLQRLAKLRIVKLSQKLELLLADKRGGDIVNEIVHRLQTRAAESMTALVICDATNPKEVFKWQNEVLRYDEFVRTLAEIASEGVQYDTEFTQEDREDLLNLMTNSPEGRMQADAMGLVPEDMM